MSKKTVKNLIIFAISFILLVLFMFFLDMNRIINKQEPIFSIEKSIYEDGGTIEYIGLGYKIYKFKGKNNVENIKFGSIFSTYEKIVGDEVYD